MGSQSLWTGWLGVLHAPGKGDKRGRVQTLERSEGAFSKTDGNMICGQMSGVLVKQTFRQNGLMGETGTQENNTLEYAP